MRPGKNYRLDSLLRHFAALGFVAAALFITLVLERTVKYQQTGLMLASVVAASTMGLGPGLLATVLCLLAINYFLIPPINDLIFGPDDAARLIVFLFVSIFVSTMMNRFRRMARRFRLESERVRLVVNHVPAIFWSVNRDFRIVSLLGRDLWEVLRDDGRMREKDLMKLFSLRDPEAPIIKAHRAALEGHQATAEFLWNGRDYHVSVEPTRDAQGTVIGATGIAFDISDRKRAERERESALHHAESANRTKDEFLAMLSHELRTPLSPVLTLSALLESDDRLPPDVRDDMRTLHSSAQLEARLIDDLLDMTRIARGKLYLTREIVDAEDMLRQAVTIVKGELSEKRLQLIYDIGALDTQINVDPARIQQVFWNLLKNSIKFTPPGGTITLRTRNDDGKIAIQIADTGSGIDPELLPRVFNIFEQGGDEMTRRFGGLGLGLSISKTLVEMHSGHIRAQSDGVGRGATFTVELPLAPKVNHTTTAAPASRRLKVLLVEDDPATLHSLSQVIERAGHHVEQARTVVDAQEKVTHEQFDVLVCDLRLPDGTGWDLCQNLQTRYNVKGIAISALNSPEDIAKTYRSGFSAHLVKPIEPQKLEKMIEII